MSENVVLVTVDCFRYDGCGFNGYHRDTTPTLDELATESYLFDRAYAPGTWTSESFPGILAGLYSPDVAYYEEPRFKAIPPDAPTIATWLRDEGFTTTATITNPQLSRERNFDRGFETFTNLRLEDRDEHDTSAGVPSRDTPIDAVLERVNEFYPHNRFLAQLRRQTTVLNPYTALYVIKQLSRFQGDWPTVRGQHVIERFIERLPSTATDQPFFAWTHLMDLHAPLHPSSIEAGGGPDDLGRYLLGDAARAADISSPLYRRMYDSSFQYVDNQLQMLIQHLKSIDVWDETVLVVTGDHGEAMGERGVNGHRSHYPYDELLHVPLLVRTPEGPGERINAPFSLSWLADLLAELLDLPPAPFPPARPSGSYLAASDERVVVTDSLTPFGHTVIAQNERFKLVRHFDGTVPDERGRRYDLMNHFGVKTTEFGSEIYNELNVAYHLPTDPGERNPRPVADAPAELHERVEEIHTDITALPRVDGRLDSGVNELLEDLGYL